MTIVAIICSSAAAVSLAYAELCVTYCNVRERCPAGF